MLQNYFLTTLRIFFRQKVYSLINILGLSVGIASAILISLYLADEISYDRFHKDSDRIFRLTMTGQISTGNPFNSIYVGYPYAEILQNQFPSIESTVRLKQYSNYPVTVGAKNIHARRFLYADSTFFDFFAFKLLYGDAKSALSGADKVVITTDLAKELFDYKETDGDRIIGKLIQIGNPESTVMITGITEPAPRNSHFHFDMICSMRTIRDLDVVSYINIGGSVSSALYFKIRKGTSVEQVTNTLPRMFDTYTLPAYTAWMNTSKKEATNAGLLAEFHAQPLSEIHLHSDYRNEFEANGNINYIYLFLAIGIFIVLLACINFTNLSTARASARGKEIGIRKTIGAARSTLIKQFLLESLSYTTIALILALTIVSVGLPSFNILSGKQLEFSMLLQPYHLLGILILTIIVTLLAGGHSSFFMTSLQPTLAMKGKLQSSFKGRRLRETLVVFQFCISIGMMVCTFLIYQQVNYLQEKDLGFNKENIVRLKNIRLSKIKQETFKQELIKQPGVASASFTSTAPPFIKEGFAHKVLDSYYTHEIIASRISADCDFPATMDLKMVNGRFFSREFPSDSMAIVLNEKAAIECGFDTFEGKLIVSPPDTFRVIGIIKDYNYEGLQKTIRPMFVFLRNDWHEELLVKLKPGNIKQSIVSIEKTWRQFLPQEPMEWNFLDKDFNEQYQTEQKMGDVFLVFTFIAICIACLGLFGLAAFSAEVRTKEIGIRKVVGASVNQIVALITKDFVKLVAIAFVVSIPITWYGMNKWLENFAYHIDFSFFTVCLAGGMVLAIALLTVGYQSVHAAMGNPVKSLRSE
jgi:putative ABC transport system permease protein